VAERISSGSREGELRALLHDAHGQLADRDALIARLLRTPGPAERHALELERAALDAEREAMTAEREAMAAERRDWSADSEGLRRSLAADEARLADMLGTRVWRVGRLWWKLRDLLHGR
jgi:uncharacterized protein YceH (UPF0502 family)